MWAGFVGQAAIDKITSAIAQNDAAARVERSENDFAGRPWRENLAGLRINDFDEREIRIDVVAAGGLVVRERTFGPGLLGLGETVGGEDVHIGRAQLAGE